MYTVPIPDIIQFINFYAYRYPNEIYMFGQDLLDRIVYNNDISNELPSSILNLIEQTYIPNELPPSTGITLNTSGNSTLSPPKSVIAAAVEKPNNKSEMSSQTSTALPPLSRSIPTSSPQIIGSIFESRPKFSQAPPGTSIPTFSPTSYPQLTNLSSDESTTITNQLTTPNEINAIFQIFDDSIVIPDDVDDTINVRRAPQNYYYDIMDDDYDLIVDETYINVDRKSEIDELTKDYGPITPNISLTTIHADISDRGHGNEYIDQPQYGLAENMEEKYIRLDPITERDDIVYSTDMVDLGFSSLTRTHLYLKRREQPKNLPDPYLQVPHDIIRMNMMNAPYVYSESIGTGENPS